MAYRIKETEARKKWCPFVQVAAESEGYFGVTNRGDLFSSAQSESDTARQEVTRCIGSECMAWDPSDYAEDSGSCGRVR